MKTSKLISGATVCGVIASVILNGTALAWHPEGTITKSVQDITSKGSMQAADTNASAVVVKPGDILDYEVVVSNTAPTSSDNENDMANTVMSDTLPNGVVLLSDASTRSITENIGTIKPGEKVSKDYLVKVTANTDGEIIVNQACFTGNSIVNDDAQNACDVAEIKISNPAPVTASTTTAPSSPPPSTPIEAAAAPQAIPNTGPGNGAIFLGLLSLVSCYLGHITLLKNRVKT